MCKLVVGDIVRRKEQFRSDGWNGVCIRRGIAPDARLILEKVDDCICRVSGIDLTLLLDRFELAKGKFKDE